MATNKQTPWATVTIRATSDHAVVTIDAGVGYPEQHEFVREDHGIVVPDIGNDWSGDELCEFVTAFMNGCDRGGRVTAD